MRFKLPTIDIRVGSRDVDVHAPDMNGTRRDLADIDLRGKASDLRDATTSGASSLVDRASSGASTLSGAASSGASTLRDMAVEGASKLGDLASSGASDLKDRAQDVKVPDVKLPNVSDLPSVDVAKAVAPAAKAIGDGIEAVAESFRSVGRGINDWRNPPKKEPPVAEAGVALLAGVGGGMALMYFMDPKQGRRRRTLLVARVSRWSKTAVRALEGTTRDLSNRAQGLTHTGSDIDADEQSDVLGGPDASANLEEIDRAAGREPGESFTGGANETTSFDAAAGTSSDPWEAQPVGSTSGGSSPELYGQGWGERAEGVGQEVGSFGDTGTSLEPSEEERSRIASDS